MKTKLVFFPLVLLVVSMIQGCASSQPIVPVTGGEMSQLEAANINSARDDVMQFIEANFDISAAHPSLPPANKWEMAARLASQSEAQTEYIFTNNAWTMILRQSADDSDTYIVAVSNAQEGYYWCGCVSKDGDVTESLQK